MEIAQKYFKEFGDKQKPMAASVQALTFCQKLISTTKIDTILDSGSGLSSAFFHSMYNGVVTVDDDSHWANRTKKFLSSSLNKDIVINSIDAVVGQKFDFVFYDYGNMETRIFYFKRALEMSKRIFYIDDMHVTYYREYIQAKFGQYHLRFIPETVDEFGRYGAIIVKS